MILSLEKQVCNLELAEKLKELGVRQDSLFNWKMGEPDLPWEVHVVVASEVEGNEKDWIICSAFTIAELGEMLPGRKEQNGYIVYPLIHKNEDGSWTIRAMKRDVRHPKKLNEHFAVEVAITEADARAKMLIYLIEHKFITLP